MIGAMFAGALLFYIGYSVGRGRERRFIEQELPAWLVRASTVLQTEMNRRAIESEHRV